MKTVFSIVDYSFGPKLNQILIKEGVAFRLAMQGYGSAESEWLDLMGLGENKKTVMISIMQGEKVPLLYKRLDREMNLKRAGTGIAFSIPLKSLSAAITKMCTAEINVNSTNSTKENDMVAETPYELIVTIVTRGYFDVVKDAARSAGARGGTLIHGLGIGGEEAAKFLGIHIQPEKDVILIVARAEDKQAVMKRIIEDAGILKESRGVCFSLPVETAFGLADTLLDDEEEED